MARNILNDYGDGVAEIYRKKDVEKNVKSLDDLEYLGFLCFTEKAKRQQDITEEISSSCSMVLKKPGMRL